jgi:hypothetical protein
MTESPVLISNFQRRHNFLHGKMLGRQVRVLAGPMDPRSVPQLHLQCPVPEYGIVLQCLDPPLFTTHRDGEIYTQGTSLTCYLEVTREEAEAVLGPAHDPTGDYRQFYGDPSVEYVQSLFGWHIAWADHMICTIYEMDRHTYLHVGSYFGYDYRDLLDRLDTLFPGKVIKCGKARRYKRTTRNPNEQTQTETDC